MKTAIGVTLLIVGLVIGVSASAILSIGTKQFGTTSTSVSIIFSTIIVTYTTTSIIQESLSSQNSQVQSGAQIQSSSSTILTSISTGSSVTSTIASSESNSGDNVTISGPVTVNNGTPYQVVLSTNSGEQIVLPVAGGQEISASVPNNETYSVVVYFYIVGGGEASCDALQPLYVYSQLLVLAVNISC